MGAEATPAARRVVIDCDPGHDDAVALLLAAGDPRLDLLGITTVAGNQTLDRVTHNARVIATVAGLSDVPIVAGSVRPLVRELRTAPEIHGESGLDGPPPIEPTVALSAGHGAQFIAEAVLADSGRVTVVPTGPLTNVALALRMYPEIAGAVERVVLMGGSYTRGNTTPAAEFNIYVDPEAADAVFAAGWDLTMIGLDVTHLALYTPQVGERLAQIDTRAARWMAELLTFFGETYRTSGRMGAPPIHDAVAVASVIDPSLVTTRDGRVEIETAGRLTRGMTVVDFEATAETGSHHIGVDLDAERFWDLVLSAVRALP
ncbi:MAG TPA: nucleoside hydrolase [Solirubrobacteraceae bacterium]|nr:nucleoside hydrolase [Solirubrobacteraceae bacterium]